MADLISPSEKLAYLEEQKRRMQEAVANTRPDALAEEGMALGRAGAPAVPPGPQGAPPVAPGEDQTRSFPEWQSLQRIEQEGVPRPGMTGYQPPEPGEETDYSSWMAKYAKPGGQQEYEQARPGLETVPWIRPVAGRAGVERKAREVPPGVAVAKPPKPLSATEKFKQEQMTIRANIRATSKKMSDITSGGTKTIAQMGLGDLEKYKKMLQTQKQEMPTTAEGWIGFRKNVPVDMKGAVDINDLIKQVDEAIRGWGKKRLGKDSLGILGG